MQTEALNPLTTSDEIERAIKVGSMVSFSPKHAVGGAKRLRKSIKGRVRTIDKQAGTVLVGDWLVPIGKVQRLRKYVHRDWQRQEAKAVRQHVYGDLARGEKGKLRTCAADARRAFIAPVEYSGPADAGFYADVKRARDRFMREKGIEDTSDLGQCEAFPLFLERALKHGKTPQLDTVRYLSSVADKVGVGDTITLVGKPYQLTEINCEGQAILKGPHTLRVPMESIPTDRDPEPVPVASAVASKEPSTDRMPKLHHRRRERKVLHMPGVRRAAFHYRPERTPRTARTMHRRGRHLRRDRCKKTWVCRDRVGRFSRLHRDLRAKAKNPPEAISWLPWLAGGLLLIALLRPKGASHG